MKVIDFHTHSGGKNYSKDDKPYNSSIKEYNKKINKLKNYKVEKTLTFAQPRPYDWLLYYKSLPCIDFSPKNNQIAQECELYNNMLFAVFVDARDYRAGEEINRCVKNYDTKVIKLHFGTHTTNPENLNRNGVINCAGEYDLPILLHAAYENEYNLELIVKKNPDLNFIFPHLGFMRYTVNNIVKKNNNAYLDTSAFTHNNLKKSLAYRAINCGGSSYSKDFYKGYSKAVNFKTIKTTYDLIDWLIDDEIIDYKKLIESIVKEFGSEKIIFGSDEAWCPIKEQLNTINQSGISKTDKKNILYKNAESLLR